MKTKHLLFSTVLAMTLVGCASTNTDKSSQDAAKDSKAGSTDNFLSLMMGGERDPEKLAALIAEAEKHPLGSLKNPVRVNMPIGERKYLLSLRCSDGATPKFSRDGSFGAGPYGTILDRYTVICENGTPEKSSIYMDMYFPKNQSLAPVDGFTF